MISYNTSDLFAPWVEKDGIVDTKFVSGSSITGQAKCSAYVLSLCVILAQWRRL